MKAVVIRDYGDAGRLELRDVPDPQPGPDEILIRVQAGGVNPLDWKIRQGQLRFFLRPAFPYVLGSDVSGEVVSAGILAKRFKPGDPVFGFCNPTRGEPMPNWRLLNKRQRRENPTLWISPKRPHCR